MVFVVTVTAVGAVVGIPPSPPELAVPELDEAPELEPEPELEAPLPELDEEEDPPLPELDPAPLLVVRAPEESPQAGATAKIATQAKTNRGPDPSASLIPLVVKKRARDFGSPFLEPKDGAPAL
jgi:hypothetical protein